MKRILGLILAVCMLVIAVPFAASANNDVTVTLDGKVVDCNAYGQPATIVDGRTLVPLRAIFEALGASVEWNAKDYVVTSTLGEITISLKIGEKILYRNGTPIELDVPAMLMNDRTMVPVRAVSESFGVEVDWDSVARKVILAHRSAEEEKQEIPGKTEVIIPSGGSGKTENSAADVLALYLDAMHDFDFTRLAKYCVDSHGMEKLGVTNLKETFDKLGFTVKALSDSMVSDTYNGNEDYRPVADVVAQVTYDYMFDVAEKLFYEIELDSIKNVDSKRVQINVLFYGPDTESIGEGFADSFDTAMKSAFADGSISLNMEQSEMMEALAPMIKQELEKAIAPTLDKDDFVITEAQTFTLVKGSNGKWLVEYPEEDMFLLEAMKKGSFDGLIDGIV